MVIVAPPEMGKLVLGAPFRVEPGTIPIDGMDYQHVKASCEHCLALSPFPPTSADGYQ